MVEGGASGPSSGRPLLDIFRLFRIPPSPPDLYFLLFTTRDYQLTTKFHSFCFRRGITQWRHDGSHTLSRVCLRFPQSCDMRRGLFRDDVSGQLRMAD
jgi:hypothetical protein